MNNSAQQSPEGQPRRVLVPGSKLAMGEHYKRPGLKQKVGLLRAKGPGPEAGAEYRPAPEPESSPPPRPTIAPKRAPEKVPALDHVRTAEPAVDRMVGRLAEENARLRQVDLGESG